MPLWGRDGFLGDSLIHRIGVTGIFTLHEWLIFEVNVGKYTILTCILYMGNVNRSPLKNSGLEMFGDDPFLLGCAFFPT